MRQCILGFLAFLIILGEGSISAGAEPITQASDRQLQQWLKEYPGADANRDGRLTMDEAQTYRRKLEQKQRTAEAPIAFQHEYTFATMSDGVKIALAVGYPRGFSRDSDRKWPVILSLCGYPSATVPIDPGRFGHRCVTVSMSIRGSGASGGKLSPWRPRSRQDGYETIEDWIVKQPWSNGRVGIVGHSWPGLMGFLVSTTAPPSLRAVCVSGLIEDFYRGIARVGGVRNCGFPVEWLNSFYGIEGPFGSGESARQARGLDEPAYRRIIAARPARDLRNDFLWLLMHQPFDTPKMHKLALRNHAAKIRAPILIGQSYQDEQTGPNGWWLWKHLPEDVPKRLFLSNGSHGVTPGHTGDLQAWLEHWLLGEGDGRVADPQRRVQVYFETAGGDEQRRFRFNRPLEAADFPLPGTRWTRLYLRSGKTFSTEPPDGAERPDAYRVAHGAQRDQDEWVDYSLEINAPTAISGPIVLSLWLKTTTLDTDLFALVADLDPDGNLYGLQRGLLRASHRQLDEAKSVYVVRDGQKLLIRPWHPHTSAEPVRPYEACRYEIEIPALGHVFRPGHRLVLRLSRPPEGDPVGVTRSGAPSYRYDSDPPPGTIQILHDAEHPSSLLLPVLPELPPVGDTPPPLADQAGLQQCGQE
jgi:predicted acyl esterase